MMSEEYAVLTAAERGRHDADGVEASSIEVVEVVTNDANYESEGLLLRRISEARARQSGALEGGKEALQDQAEGHERSWKSSEEVEALYESDESRGCAAEVEARCRWGRGKDEAPNRRLSYSAQQRQ